jgi:phage terminase large subunit-like protein
MAGSSQEGDREPVQSRRQAGPRSQGKGKPKATRRKAAAVAVRRPDRAENVIRFLELLTVPSGVGQGTKLKLREWQKEFIRDIYEPHGPNGRRLVRRAILSMARKNGKTFLVAGLALAHLCGPEAIPNAEIYSAANDREQASLVFRMAAQIVRADPELNSLLRVVDSTKTIAFYRYGSVYRALSSESGTKHGLNPTMVIFDELAQAKSRDLYDVLDTSMGARLEPLFVTISTQSNDPQHILSKLIDDGLNADDPTTVCHLYSVPDDWEDIYDPSVWKRANPALGDFRDYGDFKALAEKAKRMPAEEPKFRNLFLNQRCSAESLLISRPEWMACVGDVTFQDGEPVYLALDLSSTTDLTALVMVSADDDTSRVLPFFWKPAELLREQSDRDFGSGNHRYSEWHDAGHLDSSPGRSIDPAVVATRVAELVGQYDVKGLAYDRWGMKTLLRDFDRIGLQCYEDNKENKKQELGLRLVPWGQGFQDMGPAVNVLIRAVADRKLVHANHPVLNWNMGNAVAVMDTAGFQKIDKSKARFRIDGAVTLAMALGLKARDRQATTVDIETLIV